MPPDAVVMVDEYGTNGTAEFADLVNRKEPISGNDVSEVWITQSGT